MDGSEQTEPTSSVPAGSDAFVVAGAHIPTTRHGVVYAERKVEAAEEAVKAAEEAVEAAEQDVKVALEKVKTAKSDDDAAEAKVELAEAKVKAAKREVTVAEAKVTVAEAKVKVAEGKVHAAEDKLDETQAAQATAQVALQAAERAFHESSTEEKSECHARVAAAKATADIAKSRSTRAQNAYERADEGLKSAQDGLKSAQNGFKSAQAELEAIRASTMSMRTASTGRGGGGSEDGNRGGVDSLAEKVSGLEISHSAAGYTTPPRPPSARLKLRNDIKLWCIPFDGHRGSEQAVCNLPEECSWAVLVDYLSSLQWQKHRVGSKGPTLDADGKINVKKAYYTSTDEKRPRKSCTSTTQFTQFVKWYECLPRNAAVKLVLWNNATLSPPPSPGDAGSHKLNDDACLGMATEYLKTDESVRTTLQKFGGSAEEVFGITKLHGLDILAFKDGSPCIHTDAIERGAKLAWSNEGSVMQILASNRPEVQAIIGPSGAGKSTTVYRALAREFGCYLDAAARETTRAFMRNVDHKLRSAQVYPEGKRGAVARRCIMLAHLSLLLVLRRFKELVPMCTPKQWTYLMISASASKYLLHASIDDVLHNVFVALEPINNDFFLHTNLKKLTTQLHCRLLYLDEAQEYLNLDGFGTFTGGTGTAFRSILSPLLAIPDLVVSGTGLNLQQVAVELGSHAAKEEPMASPQTNEESPRETEKAHSRRRLARKSLLSVPGCNLANVAAFLNMYGISSECTDVMMSLRGRARLVANCVRQMLMTKKEWDDSVFTACAAQVLTEYTSELVRIMSEHFSSNEFVKRSDHVAVNYQHIAISLLNCAVYNGGCFQANCNEVIDFIDASMCMLQKAENGEFVAFIQEQAAIDALFEICRKWKVSPLLLGVIDHMHNIFTDRAGQGLDFEYLFIADVAMRALRPDATEQHRKIVFGDLVSQLLSGESPAWPQWRHNDWFEIVDCRQQKCKKEAMTLQVFLQNCTTGVYDNRTGPLFCLPETAAGPDIVALLRDREGKKILWMTQCKRWSKNLGGEAYVKAVNTTLPTELYHRNRMPPGRENKQNGIRTLCESHFSKYLAVLCAVPTRTSSASTAPLMPDGTHFVFIDENILSEIMSDKGFSAAKNRTFINDL